MSICDKCTHRIVCDHESAYRKQCMFFEETRQRGEWKNGMCTNCGAECFEDYYMRDIKTEFCHRCGADMRKKSPCDHCIDDSDCDRRDLNGGDNDAQGSSSV